MLKTSAFRGFLFAVLLLLAIQAPAQAGVLAGDTVGLQYFYPDLSSLIDDKGTLTAPGTFVGVDSIFDLVVNDTSITVPGFYGCPGCWWSDGTFNGFVLTDYSNSPITSVAVNPSTTMPGFTAANVSWTANTISVHWQGLTLEGNVTLDINGGGGVPEPATWLLLGTSLAGLLAWRRRRRA